MGREVAELRAQVAMSATSAQVDDVVARVDRLRAHTDKDTELLSGSIKTLG